MKVEVSEIDLTSMTPLDLFEKIPRKTPGISFLVSDGSKDSQYSILASNPVKSIRFNGEELFVDDQKLEQSLSEVLNSELVHRRVESSVELPFLGGLIGSIDYEYGYQLLNLNHPYRSRHLVHWNVYDHVLIYDHHREQWYEVKRGSEDRIKWREWIDNDPERSPQKLSLHPLWDSEKYEEAFSTIQENIRLGEIYQACLTFAFNGPAVRDPRSLFIQLLQRNPAPMAAYLEQDERSLLSLSPERFLDWDGKIISTKPIKGTRPRGATSEEDERLKLDLLKNEKELAELNMITDLLRNDLAKVSKPGTVSVLKYQELLECPTVWHTFSHIQGRTKERQSAWNIIEEMFPGGSISGCPKRRAVELLQEIEGSPRGIYTGCIGYISDHGRMDLNIAIRTLEQFDDRIRGSFGGGIVYDSLAEQEYQECFDKAEPFLKL